MRRLFVVILVDGFQRPAVDRKSGKACITAYRCKVIHSYINPNVSSVLFPLLFFFYSIYQFRDNPVSVRDQPYLLKRDEIVFCGKPGFDGKTFEHLWETDPSLFYPAVLVCKNQQVFPVFIKIFRQLRPAQVFLRMAVPVFYRLKK